MCPFWWLEVLVLSSCVAWVAGQEDVAQPNVTRLVSAELHPNAEGNLETRCVVLTFPEAARQPQTSSTTEQPAVANTTLHEPSPKPSGKCLPPGAPTQVYDSESLFGALAGAAPDVSFIREEAKNYFVAYNRERSLSKAQVMGMILVAMMAEHKRIAADINLLKAQIRSGGLEQEEPQIAIVCLPDGFKEERVLNGCMENETGAVDSKTSYAQAGMTSSIPPFQTGDAQQSEKREVKTVIDLLKGSTWTSPDNRLTQTYLPSGRPLSSFSSFTTSSEQLLSGSGQPPPVTVPEVPAAVDPPTTQSPPSQSRPLTKNGLQPTNASQTAAVLQFSVSGMLRAVLPLPFSKVTAELSLSFAPLAQTSLISPSTAKPNTSKSTPFLKPNLRLSPKATASLASATTPTTAGSTSPPTAADFITSPHFHFLRPHSRTLATGSSTAALPSATTSSTITPSVLLKNISSSPHSVESTPSHSPSSPITIGSPTASQFSTQPGTTPASSEVPNTDKQLARWVTSE